MAPTIYPAPNKKKTALPIVESKHMGPLTAFARQPKGVHFETQELQEEVILFLRQHIIINIPWIIVTIALLLTPFIIFPAFFELVKLPFTLPFSYTVVGTMFWYLATFGFALSNFLGWFFNIYIVTNQRVVDIDFVYLLYKQFSEAELDKIQDLSFTSGGVLAAFFNYGNVSVQTAAEIPNLEFGNVPQPDKVVEIIRSLIE